MRIASLTLLLVFVACAGSGSTGPGGSANVAGDWSFSVNLTDCVATATISLTQSGENFSGSASGTESCPPFGDAAIAGPITGGVVAGTAVSFDGALPFDNAGCVYQGTASGSPPNHMTGAATCFDSSANATSTGAWQASR